MQSQRLLDLVLDGCDPAARVGHKALAAGVLSLAWVTVVGAGVVLLGLTP